MKLSVIVPAHSEEKNILNALRKITSFLNKRRYEYELIVSEDGSTDKTYEIAQDFARANKRVKVIHSGRRLGKGGGIIRGFKIAKGDIISFIDADLSSDPTQLEKVVNAVKGGADVAIASRHLRSSRIAKDRPPLRRIAAKGMNLITNAMFDLSITDTQCGLKALSRNALAKILPQLTRTGFEFDVELLLRAKNLGMTIKEVPIVWEHKQSTAKISGLPLRTARRVGFGLLDLWIKNSFNRSDMFFFLFLMLFAAIGVMFLSASIDPDEGTHLSISAFLYNFFSDFSKFPTVSFSKLYDYAIAYLVRYPKLSLYYPLAFHSLVASFGYLFGLSAFEAAAVGLLFGIVTILAVYYFGRKFVGKDAGIVAAVLFAVVPQVFYLSVRAMLDLSYLFFFVVSLAFYLFAFKSGKRSSFIVASILLAVGFYFKQNVIFVGPIVFLYSLLFHRKLLKEVFISLIIFGMLIAPHLIFLYKTDLLFVFLKSSITLRGLDEASAAAAINTVDNPPFTTIDGWLYYPKQLAEIYLSLPVFLASIASLAYYVYKREKYWQIFALWFAVLYLFFVYVPNKEPRYILPAIPALLFPLAFYISKLPKKFSLVAAPICFALILYVSYQILPQTFYYNTQYAEIAAAALQKEGNILLAADSSWFYSSPFIFEVMRQDVDQTHSVFRECVMDVRSTDELANKNGIRYAIVPEPLSTEQIKKAADIKDNANFKLVKTFEVRDASVSIYENVKYVKQKENCNYICVSNQWICSNFTAPVDALR